MGAFGAALQRLREDRRLTLSELARRSGVSRHALGRLERGTRPRVAELEQLADALGLGGPARQELREIARADAAATGA